MSSLGTGGSSRWVRGWHAVDIALETDPAATAAGTLIPALRALAASNLAPDKAHTLDVHPK